MVDQRVELMAAWLVELKAASKVDQMVDQRALKMVVRMVAL